MCPCTHSLPGWCHRVLNTAPRAALQGRAACPSCAKRLPLLIPLSQAFLPRPLNSSGLDSIPGTFFLWRGRHSAADQAWASLGESTSLVEQEPQA